MERSGAEQIIVSRDDTDDLVRVARHYEASLAGPGQGHEIFRKQVLSRLLEQARGLETRITGAVSAAEEVDATSSAIALSEPDALALRHFRSIARGLDSEAA